MQKQKDVSHKREAATTAIPDKLYFRIGEVAKLCQVETYVLRFWESEFPQLKPNKSGTGQRLYRKRDVEMALRVKRLLHDEGYTIAGARQLLQAEGRDGKKGAPQPELPLKAESAIHMADKNQAKLQKLRSELKELLGILSAGPASSPRERKLKKSTLPDGPGLFTE